MSTIYKDILSRSLPRLINLYNLDSLSPLQGNGDRMYHGWKVQDFSNGTFLGGIHTIAIAYKLGLLPQDFDIKLWVNLVFKSIPQYISKNGSTGEAYPNENSFCVSALAAFDLLSSLQYLEGHFKKEELSNLALSCKPFIDFITKHGEEHGIISNHLATGVAAVVLWNYFTGDQNDRYKQLLDIIYKHQSQEGWFKEYEGADPGYQTLCTYYLEAAQIYLKDEKLAGVLQKSIEYLQYFVHPDGTIGGLYGSRNTQVYYPGGVANREDETSISIAKKMLSGIENGLHITPLEIDIGNLIPLINSYAFAAFHAKQMDGKVKELPYANIFEKDFTEAGIYLHANESYYALVNYKKGGTIKVYNKKTNSLDCEDGGVAGKLIPNITFSTQQYQAIVFDNKEITSNFYTINHSSPTPLTTIILRLLSISIFRSVYLGNVFKKFIVKRLMTGKNKIDGYVQRQFNFSPKHIEIIEKIKKPSKVVSIGHFHAFRSIHMASSSYNPRNTWTPNKRELVTFIEIPCNQD